MKKSTGSRSAVPRSSEAEATAASAMSSACAAKSRSPSCHQTVTSSPASCCHAMRRSTTTCLAVGPVTVPSSVTTRKAYSKVVLGTMCPPCTTEAPHVSSPMRSRWARLTWSVSSPWTRVSSSTRRGRSAVRNVVSNVMGWPKSPPAAGCASSTSAPPARGWLASPAGTCATACPPRIVATARVRAATAPATGAGHGPRPAPAAPGPEPSPRVRS